MVDVAFHRFNDPHEIFVSHCAKEGKGLRKETHVTEIIGKMCRRVRVVSDIQDHRGPPRQHLKTPRKLDPSKTGSNGLLRYR